MEAEPEWTEISCLCSAKAQNDLLWENLGKGGGGRSGTALPRQLKFSCPQSLLILQMAHFFPLDLQAARKGVRQSQPEFHMEPLRMENRHLLGSWLLAFQKP